MIRLHPAKLTADGVHPTINSYNSVVSWSCGHRACICQIIKWRIGTDARTPGVLDIEGKKKRTLQPSWDFREGTWPYTFSNTGTVTPIGGGYSTTWCLSNDARSRTRAQRDSAHPAVRSRCCSYMVENTQYINNCFGRHLGCPKRVYVKNTHTDPLLLYLENISSTPSELLESVVRTRSLSYKHGLHYIVAMK